MSNAVRPARLTLQDRLHSRRMETEEDGAAYMMIKIKTANAQEMRLAIADIEKFGGELGELAHFLKAGDSIMAEVTAKVTAGWLEPRAADSLRAALVRRIKRPILNLIQSDETTPWERIKERLKRSFGGGRWTPEEDIWKMFRECRNKYVTDGQYATRLITWYTKVNEKLSEQAPAAEVEAKMAFLGSILCIQLKRETKKSIPDGKTFLEAAREMVDECEREAESREIPEDNEWRTIERRRPWPERNSRERSSRPRRPLRRRTDTYPEEGRRGRPNFRGEGTREKRCYECGRRGHLAAQCERTKCFECQTPGHLARQCPYLKRRTVDRGEPMEINAQRIRRRKTPTYSSSEGDETESGSEQSGIQTHTPQRATYAERVKGTRRGIEPNSSTVQ